ncbi:RraA family protein [Streptomyces sp. NPDC046977]|uniref:RraA family protein n=1 Tax=Streptomyces sp. NPDC046977 TaxID=3154703 RepID=UPI0033F4B30D
MTEELRGLRGMLEQVDSASLVDAMGRVHGHRADIVDLVSPDPSRVMFGPAVTVAFLPYRDDLPEKDLGFATVFYRAVGDAPEGKVVVMSSGGHPDVSHAGGTKLSRLHNHHVAGVLADGRLRDFSELAGYGFATWCRGQATHWGGATVMPYAANIAVEIGGVCVVPGDYVYADSGGAVVIPAGSVRRVLEEAVRIEAEDKHSAEVIRAEDPVRLRSGEQTASET